MKKQLSKKLQSKWKLKRPLYIEKTDKRYKRYMGQLKTNGFSDTETWSLDSVICEFALPRLIRFKEVNNGFPIGLTPEKWDVILDMMIFALKWNLEHEDEKYDLLSKKDREENWLRHQVGMEFFFKHFRDLWW